MWQKRDLFRRRHRNTFEDFTDVYMPIIAKITTASKSCYILNIDNGVYIKPKNIITIQRIKHAIPKNPPELDIYLM